ncbi:nudix hydrolase 7-like [Eucalyptus grandis]|uniref:nudix hydrolase 7-like n=1 Tax=Eucalyptus grandis TaxID=71139 RepID=UPI00192E9A5D|nr:nudix hydrolase 7-like [Eucalyptus grandis]
MDVEKTSHRVFVLSYFATSYAECLVQVFTVTVSADSWSSASVDEQDRTANSEDQEILGREDAGCDGVEVEIPELTDTQNFINKLRASISKWRELSEKRRGVWIKVPIEHAHLVESPVTVLVVTEKGGKFKGTGIWNLLTGLVNEGEDVFATAIREVKEKRGISDPCIRWALF